MLSVEGCFEVRPDVNRGPHRRTEQESTEVIRKHVTSATAKVVIHAAGYRVSSSPLPVPVMKPVCSEVSQLLCSLRKTTRWASHARMVRTHTTMQ